MSKNNVPLDDILFGETETPVAWVAVDPNRFSIGDSAHRETLVGGRENYGIWLFTRSVIERL
jgi:hypothetical protein